MGLRNKENKLLKICELCIIPVRVPVALDAGVFRSTAVYALDRKEINIQTTKVLVSAGE
jgi:hypothetical protein